MWGVGAPSSSWRFHWFFSFHYVHKISLLAIISHIFVAFENETIFLVRKVDPLFAGSFGIISKWQYSFCGNQDKSRCRPLIGCQTYHQEFVKREERVSRVRSGFQHSMSNS